MYGDLIWAMLVILGCVAIISYVHPTEKIAKISARLKGRAPEKPKEPETFNRKGFVYFAEAVGSDRLKIGFSEHPDERVKGWKDGCPFPVVLLATVPGCMKDERRCHQLFALERTVREWFYASERLRYFIKTCDNANRMVWPYSELVYADGDIIGANYGVSHT